MKKLVSAVAILVLLSTTTFAKWAIIPLDELVADSDLIVIGTLHSATENSEYEGKGYIRIDEVMTKGVKTLNGRSLSLGDNLKITWADNWACAMGMHLGWQNQKGIYLLKIRKDGTVAAGYPGRFTTLDDLSKIRGFLHRKKVKEVGRVDIEAAKIDEIGSAASFQPRDEVIAVDDVPPLSDYSPYRALFTALLSLGLYLILYRRRFRIR